VTTHWPDVKGFDRGYSVNYDVTASIDGVSLDTLWGEFVAAQEIWNSTRTAIAALFTYDTTDPSDIIRKEGTAGEFEEQSEFGAPKTARAPIDGLVLGFPYREFDLRIGYTRRFLKNATAEQIRAQHRYALEADNHLLFRETMKALTAPFIPTRPTNLEGNSLYSLYAGAADDKPNSYLGRTFSANHNHFFVSGAATLDGQDLADLIESVQEHGHGLRNTSERVVIFMHPSEGKIARGFRAGVSSSPWDFIPATDAPAYLTDLTVVGDKPAPEYSGIPIFGSYGDALLSESYLIPDGYVVAVATAGANSRRNPLAFRQHPRKESQGLVIIPGTERYPLVGSTYERGFGVAVRNRGAAAVMQIKASGSYVEPFWP
jgi:hypothetical protein